MKPRIAICGTGNMGSAIGARLRQHGLRVITALEGRSAASASLAAAAGIDDVRTVENMVAESDIVLSIMGSASARAFADKVGAAAAQLPSGKRPLFVDCNPVLPSDMQAMAAHLGSLGLKVVDAGISGPPPSAQRQPRIYASGDHANIFAELGRFGLNITVVGPDIGQASALKICTAATWQGAVGLAAEVLLAAQQYGMLDALIDDIQGLQPNLFRWLSEAIPEMPAKAVRWSKDMQVTRQTMMQGGGQGIFHEGASQFYTKLGSAEHESELATAIAAIAGRLSAAAKK